MTSRLQARLLAQRSLFQRLQSAKKRSKQLAGLTLIELLIVVAIIGILSAISIPAFVNQRERAEKASAEATAAALARQCAAAIIVEEQDDYDEAGVDVTAISTACNVAAGTGTFAVAGGKTYSVNEKGQVTVTPGE
ncbi:MAG: prepilin-type N-terminal cleavage/methylation domain-containing protein [Cyanobacteria bacterium]|nr:prepilin-type N-terminal cleavage/methylation domain-containing protein [Cyanobacteriota bacterium]